MQSKATSQMAVKGCVIAGTHSGVGKTTLALGLMAALKKRGLKVAPFKVGPDFIDPGHHTRITGVPSRNLDGWMLSRAYNLQSFQRAAQGADVAVVEGVMGLFDGYDGRSETGSTAQMAKWLDLPVVLVVDAASMARSAAALIQGFERFDRDLRFAGVVFNRIGGERHLAYLRQALQGHVEMPLLGGLPRDKAVAIPERHLGLVTREDFNGGNAAIDGLTALLEARLDIAGLLERLPLISRQPPDPRTDALPPDAARVRIGVARDRAFCFYYPDNLELLEASGATLVPFSPMTDKNLPEDLDGLYFGGGYPELNAEALSANSSLRDQVLQQGRQGMPIYGECGGFMYLCRQLVDPQGRSHPMVNLFPFTTRMFPRLRALGYREVTLTADGLIGPQGARIRGHEFHYSEIDDSQTALASETCYRISARDGGGARAEGYRSRRCLGSYVHLHFGSNPEAARLLVAGCRQYRQERNPSA
jgi:cobyrinic acid a,c-diamide synthase